ncbi:MAG: hypothetical protein ACYC0E_04205, partial [Acidimicrobiales bacterium]
MSRTDEELFGRLRAALLDPDLAPGPAETARFRRALAAEPSSPPRVTAASTRRRLTRRASPWLVVVGAMVLAALGAFGGGVAANNLPGPLRAAAYDLGLPVSSPALVATDAAESQLRAALGRRDRAGVEHASAALRQRLGALTGSDRSEAGPAAAKLLAQATAFLASGPPGSRPPSTVLPVKPPETTTPDGSSEPT